MGHIFHFFTSLITFFELATGPVWYLWFVNLLQRVLCAKGRQWKYQGSIWLFTRVVFKSYRAGLALFQGLAFPGSPLNAWAVQKGLCLNSTARCELRALPGSQLPGTMFSTVIASLTCVFYPLVAQFNIQPRTEEELGQISGNFSLCSSFLASTPPYKAHPLSLPGLYPLPSHLAWPLCPACVPSPWNVKYFQQKTGACVPPSS